MIHKNKLYLRGEMKFTIVFILLSQALLSQTKDSLLFQLQSIENDTERVNQIYQAGFNLRNSNPQLAFQYATICRYEALKTNSNVHLAKSYNLLAVLFYKKADYAKALQLQKKSLLLNEKAQFEHGKAINYLNLGNIYSDIGYYKQAEFYYLQALQSYNKTNNSIYIARCLINIGVLKFTQKQFEAALQQFKQALNYATQINDIDLMASCYNNIGAVLKNLNKYDTALIYLEEDLKLRNMADNDMEVADSYINLANLFIAKLKPDSAKHYLKNAEEIILRYNYTEALVYLYKTKYEWYEMLKNNDSANVYIKKHYELKDSLQRIEKENTEFIFLDDGSLVLDEPVPFFSNKVLLYSIVVLVLIIVYLLIKNRK